MDDTSNRRPINKISNEQKTILHCFMDQHPKLKYGKFSSDFTHDSAQKLWIKISAKLNSVPGARKIWHQWRKTWHDLRSNLRRSDLQILKYTIDKTVTQDNVFSKVLSDSEKSKYKDGTSKIHAKRQRLSGMQKKLLYTMVKSNNKINGGDIDSSVAVDVKRKEWKRIAVKLNSTVGPQKTWSQWKKCWHDICKYYTQNGEMERVCNAVDEDIDVTSNETNNCKISNVVSEAQLNLLVREIVQRPETMKADIWLSMCEKLNKLGPSSKTEMQWKNVWMEYKSEVRKFVDRHGLNKCNRLQQVTYDYISQQSDVNESTLSQFTENRLNNTAEEECNIIGQLVAVKLRSMQKEQKLIAEKLISEILFQGQMEMFQYSDKTVGIPGYT